MQSTRERDFGVEVRWTESESTSTWTNARLSAAKLRAAGIRRFSLVTHAWHMPRAMLAFAGTGLDAVPAPTCLVSRSELVVVDFLTSAGAFHTTYSALHECLAIAW